jgi:hypothetical protein
VTGAESEGSARRGTAGRGEAIPAPFSSFASQGFSAISTAAENVRFSNENAGVSGVALWKLFGWKEPTAIRP